MIPINCVSKLDVMSYEKFPTELPTVPRVGDVIQSSTVWTTSDGRKIKIELEVIKITWVSAEHLNYNTVTDMDEYGWKAQVELYVTENRFNSVASFNRWYEDLRNGKHVS